MTGKKFDISKFTSTINPVPDSDTAWISLSDITSRSNWYRTMRDAGVFSVNDILALEDMPNVEGGDERYASLNYVPLSLWRELSMKRNEGGTA